MDVPRFPATVDGAAMSNAEGRMAEAYTCSGATLPCSSKITDEGFSYEQRGLMKAYYQHSPNSGGWYSPVATYRPDKQLWTVYGLGLSTLTYGTLDGEGRVQTVTASSGTNPVSGVTYNNGPGPDDSIGSVLTTTLGTGDTQNFTYFSNTGRMKTYSASVGSTPVVVSGTLNWNANGTLQQLTISDGYNTANTQVCSYLYDDFVRVAGTTGSSPIPGVNCVNGSTKVWNQTFTYGSDAFGNITKSSTGPGASWACAACYNTTTNQYNSVLSGLIRYDLDGNLTNDTFHTYTWLADGHVATIDTNTITYDALGNKVEENVGGTTHEYVSVFGVSAQMTGQTQSSATVDLPGGVQALYSGGTLQRFRFPDWQGSIRAESNPATRAFTESLAFAPFGERYVPMGAPYNVDSFTGKPDQIVPDEYDFPAREEHGGQGRWVSPDPMKGTGNKYVYADNNPLSKVDIFGLWTYQEQMDPAMQAWFEHEMNHGDPYLESRGPGSMQIGGSIVGVSEDAYLRSVDSTTDVSVEDAPRLQYELAQANTDAGQHAQESQNAGHQIPGTPFTVTNFEQLLYPNGAGGVAIGVTANCSGCTDWVQTFTRAGVGDVFGREVVDKGNTAANQAEHYSDIKNPVYGGGDHFSDMPGAPRGGSFKAVVWVGTADLKKETFTTRAAFEYSFSVSKSGAFTATYPRAATKAEGTHSLKTIRTDSYPWTIY